MAGMTNVMENKLIDWLLRGQALGLNGASAAAGSGLTNIYVALFTAAPTDAGGGTEVTGAGYARQAIACNLTSLAGTQGATSTAASSGTSGTTSNNAVIQYGAPTANWGTIVALGVFDASTAGTLMWYANLNANKTVNNGDAAPNFPISALTLQIDD